MIKLNRRHIHILSLIFFFVSCGNDKKHISNGKESISDVSYQTSDAKFPNPERGFYKYSDTNLGSSPKNLSESSLKGYRSQNITLLFRYFYLKEFRDKVLSDAALDQIDADMAVIRNAGMKCVMRFAYSSAENEPDAPLEIVLQHLDQLKPVFEKNADVIAVLQAGFIGAWGEWYYSSNNLKNAKVRADILDKMLEVLPERRMVQLRTPQYKTEYIQRTTPLTRAEAFSRSKAARLGHHNDCFLASADDYGTYNGFTVEAGKQYISDDAFFVPVGGETCPPSGVDPADCRKAENEMQNLRWSFLNEDYYHGVNDRWKTLGCMDDIIKNLGYRFVLNSGRYTDIVQQGGTMNIQIKLTNVGYAALYNPRFVEFILKNAQTEQIYFAQTNEDPRFWRPQIISEIKCSLGMPTDMPEGSYYLYINFPDAEPSLYENPNYSVQLANKDVWEPETGYNNLLQIVKIVKSSGAKYKGDIWFKSK